MPCVSYYFLPTEGTSDPFFVRNQFFSPYDEQEEKGAISVSSLVLFLCRHIFLAFNVAATTDQIPAILYLYVVYFLIMYKPSLFNYSFPDAFDRKKDQVVFLTIQFFSCCCTQIFIRNELHLPALESQGDRVLLTLDSIFKFSLFQ